MPGWKQRLKKRIMLRMLRHSRFFDEKWYREQAGLPAGTDAARHYLDGGWREHDPSPAFRQEAYLEANEDVRREGVCPLAHWLFYGRRQHYPLYPGYTENRYYRLALPRAVLRTAGEIACFGAVRRNREARLLVAAHLDCPEALEEIFEYLKNLRRYRYDLAVTIPEGERAESIRERVLRFRADAEITLCPDRGGSVLPYAETMRRRDPEAYDLVVRIRSVENDPREGRLAEGTRRYGRDRFVILYRAVLGPRLVHRNIDRLMRDESVQLVTARQMIARDSEYGERLTERYLKRFGLALEAGYTWAAGGCWMMKAACARAAAELPIQAEDFAPAKRGAFSAESALERYLTGTVKGKTGNPVCRTREAVRRLQRGRTAGSADRDMTGADAAEHPPTAAFAVTETGENAVAGDYFTALELGEALEKRGWRTKFLSRKEPGDAWYRVGKDVDVLVSMLEDYDPQHITEADPGLVTVGWARNWFDKWAESPGTNLYSVLLASSGTACRELEERTGRPVGLFPIATNPERFRSGQEAPEEYRCDYCFTGNRFGKREIESELDPAKIPYRLNIYGTGWEKARALAPYCRGHVSYADMPAVYRGARIVLDDATPSTKETGAVNSRVYDALAAGCLVLTNNARGAEETFEGLLPVYTDGPSLTEALKLYLGNEAQRREKAQALRQFVLERYTYDRRAAQLEDIVRECREEEEKGT